MEAENRSIFPTISKSEYKTQIQLAEERIKKNQPELYEAYARMRYLGGYANLPFDDRLAITKDRATSYNRRIGHLNERKDESGRCPPGHDYDCPKCKNRGNFAYFVDKPIDNDDKGEIPRLSYRFCDCMDIREGRAILAASGLQDKAEQFTFKSFKADEEWQIYIKSGAESYARDPQGWFFISGAPGAGKTHLCTAISTELMQQGYPVVWMSWIDVSTRLKQLKNDGFEYEPEMQRYKTCAVLYIDDFLKPRGFFDHKDVTAADIGLAFDVLRFRDNAEKLTIISSERSLAEIISLDEATGSRISRQSRRHMYNIDRGPDRNYRFKV